MWWCCRWSACDRLGSLWSPDKALLIDMLIGCVSWVLYDQRRMSSYEAINFHDCAATPWTKDCDVSLCARSHAWFDGSDGGTGGKYLALCLTSGRGLSAILFWGRSLQAACVLRTHRALVCWFGLENEAKRHSFTRSSALKDAFKQTSQHLVSYNLSFVGVSEITYAPQRVTPHYI